MGCNHVRRLDKNFNHLCAVGVLDCGNTEEIDFGNSLCPPLFPFSYKTSIAESFDVRRICASVDAMDGLLCVAACRLFDFRSRTFSACLVQAAYVASRTGVSSKVRYIVTGEKSLAALPISLMPQADSQEYLLSVDATSALPISASILDTLASSKSRI